MNKSVSLETERLILRKFTLEDAPAIYQGWTSDPKVAEYVSWSVHESVDVTYKVLEEWIKSYEDKEDPLRFGICLKESGLMIGAIDVVNERDGWPEIGYVLSSKYWGQGIMTEAASAFRDYLFSLGYKRIVIRARNENIGSTKVIFKLGGKFFESAYEDNKKTGKRMLINTFFVNDPSKPMAPLPNPFCQHE